MPQKTLDIKNNFDYSYFINNQNFQHIYNEICIYIINFYKENEY